eukprot:GHVO01013620.1.p1 GENE.GHVO01013620.1~~GHVO01013620.1.p1  ORF type:complete len:156 (+),score=10.58 GHVO01013620.1:374-841(+)
MKSAADPSRIQHQPYWPRGYSRVAVRPILRQHLVSETPKGRLPSAEYVYLQSPSDTLQSSKVLLPEYHEEAEVHPAPEEAPIMQYQKGRQIRQATFRPPRRVAKSYLLFDRRSASTKCIRERTTRHYLKKIASLYEARFRVKNYLEFEVHANPRS